MLDLIKYYDGNISHIEAIPQHIKNKYKESFSIDPIWLLKLAAVRAKWIDQSQSHNVFMADATGKKMHEVYVASWQMGMKTNYYYRTLGASQIEKSTLDAKKFGFTQKRTYNTDASATTEFLENKTTEPAVCSIENTDCETCQ
jgi:ribonucleoside-diphosphate reductase alpha chain